MTPKIKMLFGRQLKKLISSCEMLSIVVKEDPIPDSLASALALKRIAEHFNTDAKIFYRGEVQNKGLLNMMEKDLNLLQSPANLGGELAFVDAIPSQLKYINRLPLIVISQYVGDVKEIKATLKDIRADTGTTSSIMAEYLEILHVAVDKQLATLLLYAIRERTRQLRTCLYKFDIDAYYQIFPNTDMDLLTKLEHPSIRSETFADLAKAIDNKVIKETHLVTTIGYTKDMSTLSKVCDYLLDLEGISTVLVFAIDKAKIGIYAKSKDIEFHMRNMLGKAFGIWGTVNGIPEYASIEIPLGVFDTVLSENINAAKYKELLFESIKSVVSSRYFSVMETGR
ncbi:bifunctional oligoribonuclease/PAP phosphatase NrnA [Halobacteriota archaeon]